MLAGLSDDAAVARSAAAVPGFEIWLSTTKTTVARICSRVDALPLAIELATV